MNVFIIDLWDGVLAFFLGFCSVCFLFFWLPCGIGSSWARDQIWAALWPKLQLWQCQILNPRCQAGDRTCIPACPRHPRSCCNTAGPPFWGARFNSASPLWSSFRILPNTLQLRLLPLVFLFLCPSSWIAKKLNPLERLFYSSSSHQQLTCFRAPGRPSMYNGCLQGRRKVQNQLDRGVGEKRTILISVSFRLQSSAARSSSSEGLGSINYAKLVAADSSSNVPAPGCWRHIYQVRQQLRSLLLAHGIMAQCIISRHWEQCTIFVRSSGARDGVNTEYWFSNGD